MYGFFGWPPNVVVSPIERLESRSEYITFFGCVVAPILSSTSHRLMGSVHGMNPSKL